MRVGCEVGGWGGEVEGWEALCLSVDVQIGMLTFKNKFNAIKGRTIHILEWNGDMPLSTEDVWYAFKGDHVGTLTNVTRHCVGTPFMG